MTSRERVAAALRHETPDRVPIDLGGTPVSGIAAGAYTRVREALGFPRTPVKICEPFQLLAELDAEVCRMLGVDTVTISPPSTHFGFRNTGWKPWRLGDGTPVLVPEHFVTTTAANGDQFIYPRGDTSVPPSGHMPAGGYYFDALVRQEPIDESALDAAAWMEGQISRYTEEELAAMQQQADALYANTDLALVYWFGQGSLGDIAQVPAPWKAAPRGIRNPEDWYAAHLEYPEYIGEIYALQTEIALENLSLLHEAFGEKIQVIGLSATDFGMQTGPLINPECYRTLFKPHHRRLLEWIHTHTNWQVFFHTCGAVTEFLDDFVEIGVDILNPVQCSATGMDPAQLKARWGDRLVFWGAVVDTQHVLPFGTPAEVRAQVQQRVNVLGAHGGLVAAAIHNIQAPTPTENIIALFEALRGEA